jgi:sugar transferase (PEP-CTERM system associated)
MAATATPHYGSPVQEQVFRPTGVEGTSVSRESLRLKLQSTTNVFRPSRTLLVVSEAILICAAFVLAGATHKTGFKFEYLLQGYTSLYFLTMICLCTIMLYYSGIYESRARNVSAAATWIRLLKGVACITAVFSALNYLLLRPKLGFEVGFVGPAMLGTLVLIPSWRLLLSAVMSRVLTPEKLVILGTGESAIALAHELTERKDHNFRVLGFIGDDNGDDASEMLGSFADLDRVVRQQSVHHVAVAMDERRGRMPLEDLLHLKLRGVNVEDGHALYERVTGKILLQSIRPSALILSRGFRKSWILVTCKRISDVLASAIGIVLTAPIMALVALAIWVEDGGPVLFIQSRIGMGEKEFRVLKFRSMYKDLRAHTPSWTLSRDPRITKVGRIIRKYRLDELPQLLNVLKGDMSLVGPRPEQPFFCELLEKQIAYYAQRHTVRPGITGWAQVKYQYAGSVAEAATKLQYDLFYIKHMSLFIDLAILFETGRVLLSGEGAK